MVIRLNRRSQPLRRVLKRYRLKARLRPIRGLKRHKSRVVQNLRRGHYDIATDVPACYKLHTIFDGLALTL